MIKNLFAIILFTFSLSFSCIFLTGPVYAETSTGSTPPANTTSVSDANPIDSNEYQFDLTPLTTQKMTNDTKTDRLQKGVYYYIERAMSIMIATVGAAAVLMMVVGGFRMILGGANEEQYNHGKAMIKKAIIGIVFVLGAYILVTSVQLLIKSIFSK